MFVGVCVCVEASTEAAFWMEVEQRKGGERITAWVDYVFAVGTLCAGHCDRQWVYNS